MVATSDDGKKSEIGVSADGKKSEIGVSADWYVAFEHQRSSLIRVIFIDYQTSELQYNY